MEEQIGHGIILQIKISDDSKTLVGSLVEL